MSNLPIAWYNKRERMWGLIISGDKPVEGAMWTWPNGGLRYFLTAQDAYDAYASVDHVPL